MTDKEIAWRLYNKLVECLPVIGVPMYAETRKQMKTDIKTLLETSKDELLTPKDIEYVCEDCGWKLYAPRGEQPKECTNCSSPHLNS